MEHLWKAFGILLAIVAPIKMTMLAVLLLILADLLTGMWAAKKRGEPLSSAGMRRTISKILVYELCVICAFFLETHILGGELAIIKVVAGVIGMVELKSIIENAGQITGLDLFQEIIKRLGSINDPRTRK